MNLQRINIRNGVVMGHQFEIAELVQQYMNENIKQLIDALFEKRGVLSPNTNELRPYLSPTDTNGVIRVAVDPGFAICDKGIIRVSNTISREFQEDAFIEQQVIRGADSQEFESLSTNQPYLNLKYTEKKDNPVELVPYGNGEVDLRVKPSYELTFGDNPVGIENGVPIAQIDVVNRSLTDIREDNPAKIRVDRSIIYNTVDPSLVDDIEELFSRPNFLSDIRNLLDDRKLQGEFVVTKQKDAVDPFFIRASYEPSIRSNLRDLNAVQAQKPIEPDPKFRAVIEWNLYGVTATKVGESLFELNTNRDLTKIDYRGYDQPLYLRFQNTEYEVEDIVGPNRIRIKEDPPIPSQQSVDTSKDEAMSAGSSDPNSALTNGGDKFEVSLEPGITFHRKEKGSSDIALDSGAREPMASAEVEPGVWRVNIQSSSDHSEANASATLEVPELDPPSAPQKVELTGEQRKPVLTNDDIPAPSGDSSSSLPPERSIPDSGESPDVELHAANPFNEISTNEDGEPLLKKGDVDRYIDSTKRELRRIQSQEVALTLRVQPSLQTRNTARKAMTLGYEVVIEMLTGEGWKRQKKMKVMRDTEELIRELSWRDLISDRYRGAVSDVSDLTQLSYHMDRLDVQTDSGRPIRENDIVYVEGNTDPSDEGYWRYEPKMRDDVANNLTDNSGDDIGTYPYGNSTGYWVEMDIERGSFSPSEKKIDIPNMSGGADYRAHVRPIAEDGQAGERITDNTEDLREKYNAELGKDFHKEIGDIYSQYKKILGQVSPERFNEFLDEKIEEVRGIIDRAAQYGNPPQVEGPFKISRQPGVVRFSGRNLEKVNKIYMRFTPPGEIQENQVRQQARFKYITGSGTPQIAIMNLPNFVEVSEKAPPVVSLEFVGGPAGTDVFAVRYNQSYPSITGPSTIRFKNERVIDIVETTTYGNTVSYWRYEYNYKDEPTPVGPIPKRWPGVNNTWRDQLDIWNYGWDIAPNIDRKIYNQDLEGVYVPDWDGTKDYKKRSVVEYSGQIYRADKDISSGANNPSNNSDWSSHNLPTTPRREVEKELSARSLTFNTKNLKSDKILDIRIREMPSEQLVPQIPDKNWQRWRQYNNKAHYYSLDYDNTSVTINVPSNSVNMWVDKNFELEIIYYGSDVDSSLENGKGYILHNRGEASSRPPNPNPGDFYADTSDGEVYLYTNDKSWKKANDIESTTHTFTVQSGDSDDVETKKEVDTRFFAKDSVNPDDLLSNEKTNGEIISFHTPSKSGARPQPFKENLLVGEDLELQAKTVARSDDGTTDGRRVIMDEWRIQANDLVTTHGLAPPQTVDNNETYPTRSDGYKPLDDNRTKSAFGQDVIKTVVPVPDETKEHVLIKASYKTEQTFSCELHGHTRSVGGQSDGLIVDNFNSLSGQYWVEYPGTFNERDRTEDEPIELDGIVTSQKVQIGTDEYQVIRATDVRFPNDSLPDFFLKGPDVQTLTQQNSPVTLTFETTDTANDIFSNFASGSPEVTKSGSTYNENGKLKLDVSVQWEDFFEDTRERIYTKNDVQGKTLVDNPDYHQGQIYDFRSQPIRIKPVKIKVTATRSGNEIYHYCTVQVKQDKNELH